MLFLGFSAGLPFHARVLRRCRVAARVGMSAATIGMLSWVGIIYSIKFFGRRW